MRAQGEVCSGRPRRDGTNYAPAPVLRGYLDVEAFDAETFSGTALVIQRLPASAAACQKQW
eukprot:9324568-Pyramimonas_sp.AAC.1